MKKSIFLTASFIFCFAISTARAEEYLAANTKIITQKDILLKPERDGWLRAKFQNKRIVDTTSDGEFCELSIMLFGFG